MYDLLQKIAGGDSCNILLVENLLLVGDKLPELDVGCSIATNK